MSRTHRVRALVAATAVVLGAPMLLASPAVAASTRSSGCADVMVTGARGSGESATKYSGVGAAAEAQAKAVVKALPSASSARIVPVAYPATKTALTDFPQGTAALPAYAASVDVGVKAQRALVDRLTAECPDARIVVIGYSQGAQVVRRALEGMDSSRRAHVVAVVLVADPLRSRSDPSVRLLDAGGSTTRDGVLAAEGAPLDPALAGAVASTCDVKDPVCAHDGRVSTLKQTSRHTKPYTSSSRTGPAATWVRDVVAASPAPEHVACPDLEVVVARASGQTSYDGLGDEGKITADRIRARLAPATTIRYVPVRYPAIAVKLTDLARQLAGLPAFAASVDAGVAAARAQVAEISGECPGTPQVLVGFSQGAEVVHTAVQAMTPDELADVDAVVLLADLLRDETDPVPFHDDLGGDAKHPGVFTRATPLSFGPHLAGRVYSACHAKDPVCSWDGVASSLGKNSGSHTATHEKTANADRVAAWVAARLG